MSRPESRRRRRSASTMPSSVKPSFRGIAALAALVSSQPITTTSTSGRLSATSVSARAAFVASPRLHQSTWIQYPISIAPPPKRSGFPHPRPTIPSTWRSPAWRTMKSKCSARCHSSSIRAKRVALRLHRGVLWCRPRHVAREVIEALANGARRLLGVARPALARARTRRRGRSSPEGSSCAVRDAQLSEVALHDQPAVARVDQRADASQQPVAPLVIERAGR